MKQVTVRKPTIYAKSARHWVYRFLTTPENLESITKILTNLGIPLWEDRVFQAQICGASANQDPETNEPKSYHKPLVPVSVTIPYEKQTSVLSFFPTELENYRIEHKIEFDQNKDYLTELTNKVVEVHPEVPSLLYSQFTGVNALFNPTNQKKPLIPTKEVFGFCSEHGSREEIAESEGDFKDKFLEYIWKELGLYSEHIQVFVITEKSIFDPEQVKPSDNLLETLYLE